VEDAASRERLYPLLWEPRGSRRPTALVETFEKGGRAVRIYSGRIEHRVGGCEVSPPIPVLV
jgi:hypothetical protein